MATLVGAPWMRIRVFPEVAPPFLRQSSLYFANRRVSDFRKIRTFSVSASSISDSGNDGEGAVRVRFAPSPTGNLHVGGARTALFNYLFARAKGGKFVLRIEDTDLERSTKESEEAVLRDLSWLGLDWDEGPVVGGDYGPYRQSERNSLYKQYAEKLLETGHVYRCFCSNEELEKMKEIAKLKNLPPVYTGKWASATDDEVQEELAKGIPYTYRFRVPKEGSLKINDLIRGEVSWNLDTLGDFVIMRSNGQPVYNFCVTVDDATMAISHVIRAEEHLPNTLRQALIYKSGAIFDNTKLRWMNGQHLRVLPSEELTKLIGDRWKSTGILTESEGPFIEEAIQLLKDGIDLVPDSDKALSNLLSYPLHATLTSPEAKPVLDDNLSDFSASLISAYDSGELLSALEGGHTGWQKWVKSFGKSLKRKGKSLFMPLRVLLTGKLHGPDMGSSVILLHKAGISGVVAAQAEFIPLNERFKILRQLDWEALSKDPPPLAEATVAASN
ncbi:Glutamate-tRNA ligase, bacterial/mitochondrial [Parasponia andersonii]|uniref:Glutamate-tRNA ligase, bacterial/mitochondrial n=1 Tax=Parasponia andersonii TaxID=3476 RepID=A0A2P5DPJ0_PARAD|nr:Glutamate-tRNA ligase, bacterial/mitochondrial [Parasponia andersonii]